MAAVVTTITGYHAHVYFDADESKSARQLCEAIGHTFRVVVGRMHDKPIGPPRRWDH